MGTINLGKHKFFQPFDQLSFIQQIARDYNSGQITVFSLSQIWTIHLDNGKVVYACQVNGMWEIFYRKLQELNQQIPTLNNQVCSHLKTVFDRAAGDAAIINPDYKAICWLINQQYLNQSQAVKLIAEIVIEVMESFLQLRDAIYEFSYQSSLGDMPKLYHLDISFLMERILGQNGRNQELKTVSRSKSLVYSDLKPQKLAYFDQPRVNSSTAIKQDNEEIPNKDKVITEPQKVEPKLYKILCIDDSPTILKAIKGFLDEELFDVITINDPLKALMQILRSKPDVILLDILMPNLDGYELCSLLRKHPSFRNTPIIMVSGRNSFFDKARAKLVKSSGYLTKPFSKFDLLKIVFQQLSDKATVSHT
jgi:two-component system, chemotaxis family, response regulator PixG